MTYQPPSPENLRALRLEIADRQGERFATQATMANLCGFSQTVDKGTSTTGQPRGNASIWRKLTAPTGSKASRKLSAEAFFHLAASSLSINSDQIEIDLADLAPLADSMKTLEQELKAAGIKVSQPILTMSAAATHPALFNVILQECARIRTLKEPDADSQPE